jgi:predicted phage replisome organizer
MAENKKYYYLKLKDDFFDTEEMKILESMPNGYLYSNILLKMYLKSIKNNGELMFREAIPYNIDMLATITGHNRDIVQQAIKIFKNLRLIDIFDNGKIYMLDIQTMIGQISSEGIRKAEYREKIKFEKDNGTKLGQSPDIISISNSNSISNNNSSIKDNNIDNKRFKKPSLEDVKEYCLERKNNIDAENFINFYDSKGWKVGNTPMKDWKACVRTWEKKNFGNVRKTKEDDFKERYDEIAKRLGC